MDETTNKQVAFLLEVIDGEWGDESDAYKVATALAAERDELKRVATEQAKLHDEDTPPAAGPMPWRLQIAAWVLAGLGGDGDKQGFTHESEARYALERADALIAAHNAQAGGGR